MKKLRTLADVLRQAGFVRITGLFLLFYLLCSTAVWLSEPTTLTGVAVSYCNTLIKLRQKDTMARFMDDLEHLEELDRDELADLSRRVREYRRRQR